MISAANKQQSYPEKCGTTRSTATYATIPGNCNSATLAVGGQIGHVTIRSAGSNSQSSGCYEGNMSDPDEIRTMSVCLRN